MPPNAVAAIINREPRITAETTLRRGNVFGAGERNRMNLQNHYRATAACEKIAEKIPAIQPLATA